MTWASIAAPAEFVEGAVAAGGLIYVLDATVGWSSYNPATNAYTALDPPTGMESSTPSLNYDPVTNTIIAFFINTATRIYDIAGDSWSAGTFEPFIGNNGRSFAASGRRGRSIIYAGGYDDNGMIDIVSSYDIDGDSWTALAPLPITIAEIQGVWVGSKFYVFGGVIVAGGYVAKGYVYDATVDEWTEITGVPYDIDVAGYPSVTALLDGRLLIAGGFGSSVTDLAWYYTPLTDTWEAAPTAPFTGYKTSAVVDGVAYFFRNSGAGSAAAAAFTPDTLPSTYTGEAQITGELVEADDPSTVIATLDNRRDLKWQEILSDTGSGEITFQNDDPVLALVTTPNMLCNCYVFSVLAFTLLLERADAVLVSENEEAEEVTVWKCRGHAALLDYGLIYPVLQLLADPVEEERQLGWMGDIDDSVAPWTPATAICTVGDAQTGSWPIDWDPDFADGNADVLGPSTGTTSTAPTGWVYGRQLIVSVVVSGEYEIQMIGDNYGDVYFDGAFLASYGQETTIGAPGDGFTTMTKRTLYLSAGWHWIAWSNYNAALPPSNVDDPMGFAFTGVPVDSNGVVGTPVFSSDAALAAIVEFPAEPPGVTVGYAIRKMLEEIQFGPGGGVFGLVAVRGALTNVTLSFDDVNDSNGTPWAPVNGNFSTKIGTSFLVFLIELSSTYIDWWMTPGTFELNAVMKGTRGQAVAADFHSPTDPDDPTTGNITSHRETVEA